MEYNEVRVESDLELGQAISYLEDIVAGLKSGRLCVQHEEDELTLAPQRTVSVSIKARQKKDKESVNLKISWRTPTVQKEGTPPLRITSTPTSKPAMQGVPSVS